MKSLPLLGRVLFVVLFVMSSFGHFSSESIGFAAAQGVPMAGVLVPLSGVMELIGALSILLGYRARWGAWLIVLFLLPVTFMMHTFWKVQDPMMARMDMVMFMKNISLTGAALIIAYFGTGPLSIDGRGGLAGQVDLNRSEPSEA